MIGQRLSPILKEIEETIWEFEANTQAKPNFTMEGFQAATKIFMTVFMDKMFELQTDESLSLKNKLNMAQKAGEDIRQLIKTYTNIDTHEFYKTK